MIEFLPSRVVAVSLFGFEIHWYGLLYLAGFLVGWFLLPRLQRYRNLSLTRDDWAAFLSWCVLGVIGGGRLGYVLFYEPAYFLHAPWKIFALWEGGMASHGGFIGVILVLWFFARSRKLSFLELGDILVIPVAIALAFGRIGNFINQEVYGTVTSLPWGMAFPGADGLRHPIQFYEMATDLFAALACYLQLRRSSSSPGKTGALFLILYGVARFLLEYVRDQEGYSSLFALGITLTRGQALTIPILLGGLVLWFWPRQKQR